MSKHTPGPWTIGHDGYNANLICAEDATICSVYRIWSNATVAECAKCAGMGDARLIAAAPDLLEACEAAHTELLFLHQNHVTARRLDLIIQKLRGALAKAEGK